ncbi:MAG TPA: hypothetical protein VMX79_07735 [bacterium]|nr:hypothetical protein [bacterium]
MTKTAKIWLIIGIVVVAVLLIGCLITVACFGTIRLSEEASKGATPSLETPVAPKTEAPVTETPEPSGAVTLANFNEVQTGMTYGDVSEVFGSPGELTAQSEFGGYKNEIYSWTATKGFGSATVTLMNGKVQSKAQFGLE